MDAETTEVPYWEHARHALQQADPIMASLIRAAGNASPRPRNEPFVSLSRSIIGQQLSVNAAEAIWRKVLGRIGDMTPTEVIAQNENTLLKCGLSRRKSQYLIHLADHFITNQISPNYWRNMKDDEVIQNLTQLKGIGRWTAEMFLIFYLLRPDILPVSDVGVRRAITKHFTSGRPPTSNEILSIAEPWRPWRSVASWYLWRSLEALPIEY